MGKFIERDISNLPQETQDRINGLMSRSEQGDDKAFDELIFLFPDVSDIFVQNTGIDGEPVKLKVTTVSSE